jgi:hypothetical protein
MSDILAKDYPYPYVTLAESSAAPATPGAGEQALYVLDDGKLYVKDDAAAITQLTGSAAWTDFSASAVLTWDITPDGVSINTWKYRVVNGICYFTIAIAATDGNDATTLDITLPIIPAAPMFLSGQQSIASGLFTAIGTNIIPGPNKMYLSMQTATDGQTLNLNVSGFYPV